MNCNWKIEWILHMVILLSFSISNALCQDGIVIRAYRVGGPNKRLSGFHHANQQVSDPSECTINCYYDNSCKSYNVYKSGSSPDIYTCEMKTERGDFARQFQNINGYSHFVLSKAEDKGIYAAGCDLDKKYWFIVRVFSDYDTCFLFTDEAHGGVLNWKSFRTQGANLTAMLTLPSNQSETVTNFTWYLGDGTMRRASLDLTYGGNDKTTHYSDNGGVSWTMQPPVAISGVHGPSSPPIVTAALTFNNVTYLIYNDTVYELTPHNPEGQIVAHYHMDSTDPRNIFINSPRGMTAAAIDPSRPHVAQIYRGLRWVYYNMNTKAYVGYGAMG